MQTLPSYELEEDDEDISRPQLKSGLDEASFGERADLEWRLYHRGRFAPEHHHISINTLQRLDALFDRLPRATSIEEASGMIEAAFVHEDERRAALVPLLAVLYPLAYFDDKMPTKDIVRLIAHHERRKPAKPL